MQLDFFNHNPTPSYASMSTISGHGIAITYRARTAANYIYCLHALFIYLIPADVLSDFSTIFGVTGALYNLSYHEL